MKLLTTSKRYHRLEKDLDVNAGKLLEGVSLEQLTLETFAQVVKVAEGTRTFGERAGHSQIQIWRNWYCESASDVEFYSNPVRPSGIPLSTRPLPLRPLSYDALRFNGEVKHVDGSVESSRLVARAGLVLFPTSLCSGQIAAIIANSIRNFKRGDGETQYMKLLSEALPDFRGFPISKQDGRVSFVEALVHTEGCAEGYGDHPFDGMRNYDRVAVGHMLHPFSRFVFLVEHGCEKSLLSYFDLHLREDFSVSLQSFGKASVQADGGIDNTVRKALLWAADTMISRDAVEVVKGTSVEGLVFAVMSNRTNVDGPSARFVSTMVRQLVQNRAVVVIPENDPILKVSEFVEDVFEGEILPSSTILNAEMVNSSKPGVHLMRISSPSDYVETVTSLGATGASMIFLLSDSPLPLPGHPFIPLLRIGSKPSKTDMLDVLITDGEESLWKKVEDVLSRKQETKVEEKRLTDFQILRTMNGFSL